MFQELKHNQTYTPKPNFVASDVIGNLYLWSGPGSV